MMKDAEDGKFDVVVAKSQSRLTRNMEHLERYLHHDYGLIGANVREKFTQNRVP